jgi:hypothetical protein
MTTSGGTTKTRWDAGAPDRGGRGTAGGEGHHDGRHHRSRDRRLITARCLRREGIDCEVYEQSEQVRELGVGINVLPHAVKALAGLGLGRMVAPPNWLFTRSANVSSVCVRWSAGSYRRAMADHRPVLGHAGAGTECHGDPRAGREPGLLGDPAGQLHRAAERGSNTPYRGAVVDVSMTVPPPKDWARSPAPSPVWTAPAERPRRCAACTCWRRGGLRAGPVPDVGAAAKIVGGWAQALRGEGAAGLAEARAALALWEQTGARMLRLFLGLVGEAHRAAGEPREGLAVIDQALAGEPVHRRALIRRRTAPPAR